MPQRAAEYYGPNEALRTALTKDGNTWRMIEREAVGNDRRVEMSTGILIRVHPAVTIGAENDEAAFTITGGIGYVPITFTGLHSPRGQRLFIDGQPLDQSIHGHDFWQTNFDATSKTWSQTYNVPMTEAKPHRVRFSAQP
jgi:hypothetical protein